MALNFLRAKLGVELGHKVIVTEGDAAPYSQTTSGQYDVKNTQLTAAAKGSSYYDRTSGIMYIKKGTAGDATDWINASASDKITDGGAGAEETYVATADSTNQIKIHSGTASGVATASSVVVDVQAASSGVGGGIDITAGASSASTGGALNLKTSNQAVDLASGAINIAAGTVSGTGVRGLVTISAAADGTRLGTGPTGAQALAIATTGYVDTEIGTAVADPESRTTGAISDQAVNRNLEALDTAIGPDTTPTVRTTGPLVAANSVALNLNALDAAIGTDAQLVSANYTDVDQTVMENLSGLDAQVKINKDDISTLAGGTGAWKEFSQVITDDADLNAASNGTALSTLLPFSDDDTPNLSLAVKATLLLFQGTWSFEAVTAGAAGNDIDLVFNGSDDVDTVIAAWNLANPSNQVALTAGSGSGVPTSGTASLAGGKDSDFAANMYLFSRNNSGTAKLFKIYDDAGTLKVTVSGVTQPISGTVYPCRYDLPNSPDDKERGACYICTGSPVQVDRISSVSWGVATGIVLSDNYTPATGNPAAGDSVEAATQKIDGNVDNLTTAVGVAQGDTELGEWTGAGAESILVDDTETAKSAIQKVANEIGAAVTSTSGYVSDQAVNLNIDAIDGALKKARIEATVDNAASGIIDSYKVDDCLAIEWLVHIREHGNLNRVYVCKIVATHDGTSAADAVAVDYNESSVLNLNTEIADLVLTVDLNGATTSQVMRLNFSATPACDVKVIRTVL